MSDKSTLAEAKRLYRLGCAVHWLHPKSKRPIESGWGSGPRKDWKYLKETFTKGANVGVRLGSPSEIIAGRGFLAVVDVDVKSPEKHHRQEALAAAKALLKGNECPTVSSGRGNGSRHYYCVTEKPFKTFNPAVSEEKVKVRMPSKSPSKKELATLSTKEINSGIRIANAWEISLYSDGRQVVVPPSIHPDTGRPYVWTRELSSGEDLPVLVFSNEREGDANEALKTKPSFGTSGGQEGVDDADFETISDNSIELSWLPISEKIRNAIMTGDGVTDRSAYLLPAANALVSAGLSKNEILSVLTDRKYFLGKCAYDHAQTKNRKRAAQWLWNYTVKRVMRERDPVSVFAGVPIELPDNLEEDARATDWMSELVRTGPKGEGPPKSCISNVVLILENAVGRAIFQRDLFAFRDSYRRATPWGAKAGDNITDDDIPKIKYWLSQNYGFEPGREVLSDAITVITVENAFNPVKDWLDALPEWDGVKRLDSWLANHFEAKDDTEYLAQVFRKWMCAMVIRIYEPGAKFDWMPIFEGAQGIGKSSFGRLLCGDKYFLDWLPNLADKESALALQGMWVVEMGELASLRKNELEVVKGFITRTVDKVRPPFGKRWLELPRHCVFFGTTNRETYLRDESGNRRFKPIKVGGLDFDVLKEERIQLFSEAKALVVSGQETSATLELSGKAKIYELAVQHEKMVEDEADLMKDVLEDYFEHQMDDEVPSFNFTKFKLIDLFTGVGPLQKWRFEQRNMQFAARALKKLGGESWKSDGIKVWKLAKFAPQGQVRKSPIPDFF